MSTELVDAPMRWGTSGYGVFAGEEDGEGVVQARPAGGQRRSNSVASNPKLLLKKRGSQRSSFYGRLGTKRTVAEPDAALSKMATGKAPLLLTHMRIQFSYEENAYPAGLELDMFALLYDKEAKYLDCIFYRNTDDAAGAFSLNVATHSLAINLARVPEECGVIVLAFAVYTLGISLTEIEKGRIVISGGFMGPAVKQIALEELQAPCDGSNASGLIYLVVGEADGGWFYKSPLVFTKASLDGLMVPSKELAQEMNTEMKHPEAFHLLSLESLIKDSRAYRVRRLSQDSGNTDERSRTQRALSRSIDRANSLRQRIVDIKSSLSSLAEYESRTTGKAFAYSLLSKRVDNSERRVTELEMTLHLLQSKVDYIYAYMGIQDPGISPTRKR